IENGEPLGNQVHNNSAIIYIQLQVFSIVQNKGNCFNKKDLEPDAHPFHLFPRKFQTLIPPSKPETKENRKEISKGVYLVGSIRYYVSLVCSRCSSISE